MEHSLEAPQTRQTGETSFEFTELLNTKAKDHL